MQMPRRTLAILLSFLTAAVCVPNQAFAQVITGGMSASGTSGAAGGVPRIELNGQFAPLSPSPLLVPSLSGGLVPTLNAPSILIPNSVAVPFAAIPSLPLSVISAAPQAAAAIAAARSNAIDAARMPATVQSQLALAGEKLSAAAAKGSDQSGLLDSFFTGAKELASTLTGGTFAGAPSALTPTLSAPSVAEGRATRVPGRVACVPPILLERPH